MQPSLLALALCVAAIGCGGAPERRARTALGHVSLAPPARRSAAADHESTATFDGQLAQYITHALKHSPALRERYAQWQAKVAQIGAMRALPEPMIRYTIFLSRVETRVGPQRHRVGVSQTVPWPTVLSAGVDGASDAALAAAGRYDAEALMVTQRVSTAYWALWLVARQDRIMGEQLQLLEALSEAARARLIVGSAGLAHVSQTQLALSRLRDKRSGLTRVRRRKEATLRQLLGVSPATPMPIKTAPPQAAAVAESIDDLRAAVRVHPAIEATRLMASSKRAYAARASAQGLPKLSIGADWIEIGPASVGSPADSGKDAVSLTVGMSVPLWRGVYNGRRDAALAEGRALKAHRDAAQDAAIAQLDQLNADIEDTRRRVRLYRTTLIPQAQTTLEASLGEYQVGNLGLASALLAIRDLFELQLGRDRAIAQHRQAWAQLEALVGRKVRATVENTP